MNYIPHWTETNSLKAWVGYNRAKAQQNERYGDDLWLRSLAWVDEWNATFCLKHAMDYYDRAGAFRRVADRQERRVSLLNCA